MKHKTPLLLSALLLAATLSSCVVAPVPGGPVAGHHARSPYSPGGRVVTPREVGPGPRSPYGPYSPGGRVVTPRERYSHSPGGPRGPYSPGGVVVLPRGARPVVYRGVRYHTHGNTWYRPSGRGYVIVSRPY